MKKILIFALSFSSLYCFSQEKSKIDFVFSPGIILQKDIFIDANVFIGDVVTDTSSKFPVVGVQGWRVGLESNLQNGDSFVIAPKIGYELSATLFSLRLSAVNYFQNGNSEFRILPELGYSFGGWANLTYGYGISFNDGNFTDTSNHRISLSFNLNRRLRKAAFKLY